MFGRDWVGAGVLVYDFLLSMVVAPRRVLSIMYVWVLGPYAWVRVMLRVLWICVAFSFVSALEFATRYMCRLYLGRCWCWVVCVCVVSWRCVGRSWCVDFLQDRGCVSNRGV